MGIDKYKKIRDMYRPTSPAKQVDYSSLEETGGLTSGSMNAPDYSVEKGKIPAFRDFVSLEQQQDAMKKWKEKRAGRKADEEKYAKELEGEGLTREKGDLLKFKKNKNRRQLIEELKSKEDAESPSDQMADQENKDVEVEVQEETQEANDAKQEENQEKEKTEEKEEGGVDNQQTEQT